MEQYGYMCYTSDLLKGIAEQIGLDVTMRWADIMDWEEQEEKTADEIALDIIQRAGLQVK